MYVGDPTLWFAVVVVSTLSVLVALVIRGRKY